MSSNPSSNIPTPTKIIEESCHRCGFVHQGDTIQDCITVCDLLISALDLKICDLLADADMAQFGV